MKRTGIIGGGASGMMAAIAAAQAGAQVTVLERRDRMGKKLLATGNGKCNLSNLDFCIERDYRSHDLQRLPSFFARFQTADTIDFFGRCGMLVTDRNGYLYPRCGQASAVCDLFSEELKRLSVRTVCGCEITDIKKNNRFTVSAGREKYRFDSLILACGSPAGTNPREKLGGFELAGHLGIKMYEPLPALVQLRCRESFFKTLSGVRCMAGVTLHIEANGGKKYTECGELQLTDYGISGIPVFQLSRYASAALAAGQKVTAILDFLPEIPLQDWEAFCKKQYDTCRGRSAGQLATGLLHKKIVQVLLSGCGLRSADVVGPENRNKIDRLFGLMRCLTAEVYAANPMENAQVCMGGISLSEVNENLEFKRIPGLYVCGEMLDVDGRCGGYNLQWAWTSGYLAGSSAGRE